MCGIIVSTIDIPEHAYNKIQHRGPDYTSKIKHNNLNIIHFLLHLTGIKTLQPVVDNNIICLFNGEIYNYKQILKNSPSDVYSIIEAYKIYDKEFIRYLDGEFTIVLFDFNKNLLYISSDIFKTKPLFYNISDEIIISSYESTCKIIKNQEYNQIEPNEVLIFNLVDRKLIEKYKIYDFDLIQYKSDYNDFYVALENAILKRYPENGIPLISLSSGVDSGCIACCLNKYKKQAIYITIPKNENIEIIYERKKILGDSYILLDLNDEDRIYYRKYLENNCELFYWDWTYNPNVNLCVNGFDMGSVIGKSKILDYVKKNYNIRVLYSGIGADEVMANNSFYSCGFGNVDIFPDNLNTLFPWPNFFDGSMKNYLKGDEYVGGSFSFETRYPFCDKELVQEFLWLAPELKNNYKNSLYKPPLISYLDKELFPYHILKYGFNV